MSRETWSCFVFVLSFCACVHFLRGMIQAARSPEFKRDVEQLREQRRRRKTSRR